MGLAFGYAACTTKYENNIVRWGWALTSVCMFAIVYKINKSSIDHFFSMIFAYKMNFAMSFVPVVVVIIAIVLFRTNWKR